MKVVVRLSMVGGALAGETRCNDFACRLSFNSSLLPLTHHLLAPKDGAVAEQVHLIGGSPGKMGVVWVGPLLAEPGSQGVESCINTDSSVAACSDGIKFWKASSPWSYSSLDGDERDEFYHKHDNCPDNYKGDVCIYNSPVHYSALIEDLSSGASVLYRIKGEGEWRSFRAPPAVGEPVDIGLIADLGQYDDSVATMTSAEALLQRGEIDTMLFPGDLSYANGIGARWDSYGRMQEQLFSKVPTAYVGGNHEFAKGQENWIHYTNRYPAMFLKEDSGSPSEMFYSFDVGLAHVVMLCSYCPSGPGSPQRVWLDMDLARVDRATTSWLIGAWHAPWYTSNSKHPMRETQDMLGNLEDVIHEAGFDVIFHGHVHGYERTKPIYKNATADCGGTVYITIGDAGGSSPGSKEKDSHGFSVPWITPENPIPPMYDQPEWSVLRSFEWGHGQLRLHDASRAEWNWYMSYGNSTASDHLEFTHAKRCKSNVLV